MDIDLETGPTAADEGVRGWSRFAPLTGLAFFVLLMASAISAGQAPVAGDSGARVLQLFGAHPRVEKVSNLLAGLGVVFLVFFAAWFASELRRCGALSLAPAVFGGAVILAAGGAARAGIGWSLASGHTKISPAAAQALNELFYSHYPAIIGIAVFMFASWLAILQTRVVPVWLGWLALLIGLVAISPPTLAPLIASGVWISIVAVMMTVRAPH
ncbi:MAG: hypothetical protein M3Z50_13555 [Actinomycetota bacterium]|nr:hypothetical protein [Actinomycetota bacterium]